MPSRDKEKNREYQRSWYLRNKELQKSRVKERNSRITSENRIKIWNYLKDNPCIECGECDPIVLEFDHVKGKKKSNVSNLLGNGCCWQSIEVEIEKCEVRCANCHRRKTAQQFGWYNSVVEPL